MNLLSQRIYPLIFVSITFLCLITTVCGNPLLRQRPPVSAKPLWFAKFDPADEPDFGNMKLVVDRGFVFVTDAQVISAYSDNNGSLRWKQTIGGRYGAFLKILTETVLILESETAYYFDLKTGKPIETHPRTEADFEFVRDKRIWNELDLFEKELSPRRDSARRDSDCAGTFSMGILYQMCYPPEVINGSSTSSKNYVLYAKDYKTLKPTWAIKLTNIHEVCDSAGSDPGCAKSKIEFDQNAFYVVGDDEKIEKRDLKTGSLVTTFNAPTYLDSRFYQIADDIMFVIYQDRSRSSSRGDSWVTAHNLQTGQILWATDVFVFESSQTGFRPITITEIKNNRIYLIFPEGIAAYAIK